MLAARLKNIFFALLTVEILSSAISFIIWCSVLYRHPDTIGAGGMTSFFFLIAVFFTNIFGFLASFYHKIVHCSSFSYSVTRGSYLVAQTLVCCISLFFILLIELFTRNGATSVIIGYCAVTMILITITHFAATRLIQNFYNSRVNKLRVLVVGMNRRTQEFCNVLQSTPHLGSEVRGYVDFQEMKHSPTTYLGVPADIDAILKNEVVDVIFIFLPVRSFYDEIEKVIATAGFYGVTAYIVGNVFETDTVKKHPLCINDFGSMSFSSTTIDYFGLGVKRLLDIAVSFFALLAISPILAVVALFIRVTAGSPIIFRQERIGLNKRSFTMYKFRTMIPDAEKHIEKLAHLNEMDGPAFKVTNDPRLIKGGAFLRKYSLDELPQLWNVLRGDMSIVGPRPLPKRDYDMMREDWQRKRFSMRPGLTCIWQISGRNGVMFNQWMEMDLAYIDRWCLSLDFYIFLNTFSVVFGGSGR